MKGFYISVDAFIQTNVGMKDLAETLFNGNHEIDAVEQVQLLCDKKEGVGKYFVQWVEGFDFNEIQVVELPFNIERGKLMLEHHGYFTANLWQNEDVRLRLNKPDLSDEDCQKILSDALENDETRAQIWFAIEESYNNLYREGTCKYMCSNCGGGFPREEMVFGEDDGEDFCNSCK